MHATYIRRDAKKAAAAVEAKTYVTFDLRGRTYAIDAMTVREIRVIDVLTVAPGAPPTMRGVINVRGAILPVCDLAERFGLGRSTLTLRHPVIVAVVEGRPVALLVDAVLDIVTAAASELAATAENDQKFGDPCFTGVLTLEDGVALVMALERPFGPARAVGAI